MLNFSERRDYERRPVAWEAECENIRGDCVVGTIRNAHANGFFFVPEQDLQEADFFAEATGKLSPGETLVLTFARARRGSAERVLTRLQWKGESYEHECEGFGLAVERY